jgi:hypothetical protein
LLTKNFHLDLGEVWSNKSMHSLLSEIQL